MRQAETRQAGRAHAKAALVGTACLLSATALGTSPALAATLTPETAAGLALFGGVALAAAGFAAAYFRLA